MKLRITEKKATAQAPLSRLTRRIPILFFFFCVEGRRDGRQSAEFMHELPAIECLMIRNDAHMHMESMDG